MKFHLKSFSSCRLECQAILCTQTTKKDKVDLANDFYFLTFFDASYSTTSIEMEISASISAVLLTLALRKHSKNIFRSTIERQPNVIKLKIW